MTAMLTTSLMPQQQSESPYPDADPVEDPTRSLYAARQPSARKKLRVRFSAGMPSDQRGAVADALQRIEQLRALPEGWDGMAAKQVTDAASVAAILVVGTVLVPKLHAQIFPLAGGGLQVEWHYHHWDLEIEIDADGELYIFAADGANEVRLDIEAMHYDSKALIKAQEFLLDALKAYSVRASSVN